MPENANMAIPAGSIRFGEVVVSSIEQLEIQCYQIYESPDLGALVRTGDINSPQGAIYGVVSGIETSSLDPSRRPVTHGFDASTEEEVHLENPQIAQLLRTHVRVSVVGHGYGSTTNQYLPPLPPKLYAFVYRCSVEEVQRFTENFDFLSLLVKANFIAVDEVIAAMLRQASAVTAQPDQFLIQAGRVIASILGGDMARLNSILKRLPL